MEKEEKKAATQKAKEHKRNKEVEAPIPAAQSKEKVGQTATKRLSKKAKLNAEEVAVKLKSDAKLYRQKLMNVRAATNKADANNDVLMGERCVFDCGVSTKAWKENMWNSECEDDDVEDRPGPDEWYAWYVCDSCQTNYACPDCAKNEELDEDTDFNCPVCIQRG